jgi:serine/threonine protein kinase
MQKTSFIEVWKKEKETTTKSTNKTLYLLTDLAARNILLGDNGDAKISDFGLSRSVTNRSQLGQADDPIGPVRCFFPYLFPSFFLLLLLLLLLFFFFFFILLSSSSSSNFSSSISFTGPSYVSGEPSKSYLFYKI